MAEWFDMPKKPLLRYPTTQLKRLVWRVRDIEEVPAGFERDCIHGPSDLMHYAWLFKDLPNERFVVFVLNSRNAVAAVDTVTEGTLNVSLVHPREAFRAAVMRLGAAIIVAHNHPSGNVEPSREDVSITRQLVETGKIMGIPLHDHVIFADGRYMSFAERGLL